MPVSAKRKSDLECCRIAFEDTMLTQCDFNCILKRDTICVWVHYLCIHALCANCCFQIYSTRSYLNSLENFTQIQIWSGLGKSTYKWLKIRIVLDPRSHVASPNMDFRSPHWSTLIQICPLVQEPHWSLGKKLFHLSPGDIAMQLQLRFNTGDKILIFWFTIHHGTKIGIFNVLLN